MNSRAKIAIFCAVLICVGGVLWVATAGQRSLTTLPSDYRNALVAMQDNQVNVEIRDSASGPLQLFLRASPFFLLLGVWIFLVIRKFPNGPRQSVLG